MRKVLCVYNTDYDAEIHAATQSDVSAVRQAASAMCDGIREAGFDAELVGLHGDDLAELINRVQRNPPDLCFNICESLRGDTRNEIVVPALLDLFCIPYTGPNAMSLGLCLDKPQAKSILLARSVATPPSLTLDLSDDLHCSTRQRCFEKLTYPYFVKLAREDASIGIDQSNRVVNAEKLVERVEQLRAEFGQSVLCERYVEGREVNVTLLGNADSLRALPLHEIDFSAMPDQRFNIVSYAAKWDPQHVDYGGTVPVLMKDVDPVVQQRIESTAMAAFVALGLRDFARVDLRVDGQGNPWVIDVNPNCDLSPGAGAARAAEAGGMSYSNFLGEICELAWNRCQI